MPTESTEGVQLQRCLYDVAPGAKDSAVDQCAPSKREAAKTRAADLARKKRGPKLTVEQARFVRLNWKDQTRSFWRKTAAQWGVLFVTLYRVGNRKTWGKDYDTTRASEETKPCVLCGKFIRRRYKSGMRRSDRQWAKLETCGYSWKNYLYQQRKQTQVQTTDGAGNQTDPPAVCERRSSE